MMFQTKTSEDSLDYNQSTVHAYLPLKNQRWTDRVPNLSKAIDCLEKLPDDVQWVVIQSLSQDIDVARHAHRAQVAYTDLGENRLHESPLKNLGSTQVLRMYAASRHERWSDRQPTLRRVINLLPTLNEVDLTRWADRVLRLYQRLQQAQEQLIFRPNRHQRLSDARRILMGIRDQDLDASAL